MEGGVFKSAIRVFALFIASVGAAAAAGAQEVGPPSAPDRTGPVPPTIAWNGSYTNRIDIKVPAFHGIEPKLALSYDSARGVRNIPSAGGMLGIGWSLEGLSAIDRVSGTKEPEPDQDKSPSGRGVPSFPSFLGNLASMPGDSYLLDGQELLPCNQVQVPDNSPSCSTPKEAGTDSFTARNETFQRYRRRGSDGNFTWEITA